MKEIDDIPYVEVKQLLEFLIEESECAILDCEKMKKLYPEKKELVRMYSIKELHYEFMICRLKRHLKSTRPPRRWCENTKIEEIH